VFSRNVQAFGSAIQRTLGQLHVGVVGCGGTGSAVIEQLVRLGIRKLTLLDADTLTDSNVTRVYGSGPDDVNVAKVEIQKRNISRIAPDSVVITDAHKVTQLAAARLLDDCDVVFGCTDDNAGRMILSRLACVLMTPLIDLGVILDSDEQVLTGIFCRVTVVAPGSPCLLCRGNVDMDLANSEQMTPEVRAARVAEGYAPELPGTEPAVVTFTTMTASYAVSELLNRLTGFGDDDYPSEILIRAHHHRTNTNRIEPKPGHYCDQSGGKSFGAATVDPFLGMSWTA
jgi:molybdopterin/thiamine biosynthesis adenylyltransferase